MLGRVAIVMIMKRQNLRGQELELGEGAHGKEVRAEPIGRPHLPASDSGATLGNTARSRDRIDAVHVMYLVYSNSILLQCIPHSNYIQRSYRMLTASSKYSSI
jgi:hypothetical protein